MWSPRYCWKKGTQDSSQFTATNHILLAWHLSFPVHTSSQPAFCHLPHFLPPPPTPDSISAGLMVKEAWHGERPGESFYTVAQVGNTSHSLRVLKQEVLEVLELSCIRQQKIKEKKGSIFSFLCFIVTGPVVFNVTYNIVFSHEYKVNLTLNCALNKQILLTIRQHCNQSPCSLYWRLTCLILYIQGNLEALIHELDNLYKVNFFELPGGQCWSTWDREEHKICSLKYKVITGNFFLMLLQI